MDRHRAGVAGLVVGVVLGCAGSDFVIGGEGVGPAAYAAVPAYTLVGSYDAPSGAFGILPDGRLVSVGGVGGAEVFVQDSVNAGSYSVAGSLDVSGGIASFGASFVRVSPDGGTIAVGDNRFAADASVYTFAFGDLGGGSVSTLRFEAPNFSAAWGDDSTLYVVGADATTFANGVYEVDTGVGGGVELVIDDFGGASAGIAVRGGRLFTGNGFDNDPSSGSDIGEVRSVLLDDLSGGGAVSFEDGMTPVADALSASSLGFDPFGNLLVGGGDSLSGSGDFGYAGVVDGDRIDAALMGQGFSAGADLELDPLGTGEALYSIVFNGATEELLVVGGGTVFRYEVPAPGACGLLAAAGLMAVRRRRDG
jgi:hypothetical protein